MVRRVGVARSLPSTPAVPPTRKQIEMLEKWAIPIIPPNRASLRKKNCSNPLWRSKWKVFIICLAYRIISALTIRTEFVPDEAWQSTEVAYYKTFGRGHLTWEWMVGLRNHIYPFIITLIYSILNLFGMDNPYMLLVIPRVFQGIVTSVGDYCFYLYCIDKYGISSAKWCLACYLGCWFNFYAGSRTITNATEMALNCICMYLLQQEDMVAFTATLALNFIVRPTAIVIWLPHVVIIFKKFFPIKDKHRIPASILAGVSILCVGMLLDSYVYRKPVVAWMRFVRFNFFEGRSEQFGRSHALWYFYSALPSILGPNMLALPISLYLDLHYEEWRILTFFIFSFSLIKHKEIRFLLPVLPCIMEIVGHSVYVMYNIVLKHMSKIPEYKILFRKTVGLSFAAHGIAAIYFCLFHQGAVWPSTQYINNASLELKNPQIWVYTPCYAVPVFTYLHNPHADLQYITCGPDDMGLEKYVLNFRQYSENTTEIGMFVSNKTSVEGLPFPHFVLCFENVTRSLIKVFSEFNRNYTSCLTRVHAQFGEDRGRMTVLCLNRDQISKTDFKTSHSKRSHASQ